MSIPAAPTSLVATAGDSQASIAFTAGSTGGSAITNYQYSTDGGTTYIDFSPAQTSSPVVITGLTNGLYYTVLLKAVNAIGTGTASSSILAVLPEFMTVSRPTFAASASQNSTTITLTTNAYTAINWSAVKVGWNAYLTTSSLGEQVGTVTANNGTTTITIGSLLKNQKNTTNGGFGDTGGEWYFFAKPTITFTSSSYNTGTTGSNVGLFLTGISTNQTTGALITNHNISAVKVGWRCYAKESPQAHLGTVTAIDLNAKTVTLDVPIFTINTYYYFADPTNISIYGSVAGGGVSTLAGSIYGKPTYTGTQKTTSYIDYISTGYLCYSYTQTQTTTSLTYNFTYVGTVRYNPVAGTITLVSGSFSNATTTSYIFVHPACTISGASGIVSGAGTTTATFSASMFTTSVGFTAVTAGWNAIARIDSGGSGAVSRLGHVTSVLYPTTNQITISAASVPATTYADMLFSRLSAVPSTPTSLIATAGNSLISVAFTAPSSNGSSAITNYSYSIDGGSTYTLCSPAQTTSPILITGLTNGTTYTILLKAINSVGSSVASSSVTGIPAAILRVGKVGSRFSVF